MMKWILPVLLFSVQAFADIVPLTLNDVAVAQLEENGTYSVICKNGNRERITDLDIKLGNVCPNLLSSEPTEILSLQMRDDGDFDVVCRDLTKTVATAEDIMAGSVCAPLPPPPPAQVYIEDGAYTVREGYMNWCPQTVAATYDDGVLVSLYVNFVGSCNAGDTFECNGSVCRTTARRLTILTPTSYEYANSDGSEAGIFFKD